MTQQTQVNDTTLMHPRARSWYREGCDITEIIADLIASSKSSEHAEPLQPMDIADRIVCVGAIAVAIVVVIFALIGWV